MTELTPGTRQPQADRIVVCLPIRTVSVANKREHWAVKARRVKAERRAIAVVLSSRLPRNREALLPCTVLIERIAPRALDDDNLVRACKAIRDEVAQQLGVDDRDPRVYWQYEQHRLGVREYAVRVYIQSTTTHEGED